jgi:hypothetical protein
VARSIVALVELDESWTGACSAARGVVGDTVDGDEQLTNLDALVGVGGILLNAAAATVLLRESDPRTTLRRAATSRARIS